MSVADQFLRVDRADTVRWIACFVVVVVAHGVGALSLVQSPAASDFDAGAPVVMLELPEIAAAPTTPPTDLAPGIAEALLATAFGLAAAIPAVVIYNMFSRSIAHYRALYADTSVEILTLVSRDLVQRYPAAAPAAE